MHPLTKKEEEIKNKPPPPFYQNYLRRLPKTNNPLPIATIEPTKLKPTGISNNGSALTTPAKSVIPLQTDATTVVKASGIITPPFMQITYPQRPDEYQ